MTELKRLLTEWADDFHEAAKKVKPGLEATILRTRAQECMDQLKSLNEQENHQGEVVEILFDGPPGPKGPRFIEVESPPRHSIRFGEWVARENGQWALRFPATVKGAGDKYPESCVFEAKTAPEAHLQQELAKVCSSSMPSLEWAVQKCKALQDQGFDRVRLDVLQKDFQNAIASHQAGSGEAVYAFDKWWDRHADENFEGSSKVLARASYKAGFNDGYTHPSASVPDGLIEAVKALHIDDDMFGIDFQDEMATYQCQYCSFDMEHYGPSLDAYKLIKHDDDCPITKLRSLLATTPQPADKPYERCPHGVRHPHPCVECEDSLGDFLDAQLRQSSETLNKTSSTPPTENDADPFGKIIAYAATRRDFSVESWDHVKRNPVFYSHWKPTGLKSPNPPEQGAE